MKLREGPHFVLFINNYNSLFNNFDVCVCEKLYVITDIMYMYVRM